MNFVLMDRVSDLVLDLAYSRIHAFVLDVAYRLISGVVTFRCGDRRGLGAYLPLERIFNDVYDARKRANSRAVAVRAMLSTADCGEDPFCLLLLFSLFIATPRGLAYAVPRALAYTVPRALRAIESVFDGLRSLLRLLPRALAYARRPRLSTSVPLNVDEIRVKSSNAPRFSKRLTTAATLFLPAQDRSRREEEWFGELAAMTRMQRFRFVIGVWRKLPEDTWVLHRSARRAAIR